MQSIVTKSWAFVDAMGAVRGARWALTACVGAVALLGMTFAPAQALQIEITGGGADRLERQRSWARGDLPLPGTPDLGKLPERIASAGLKEGAAVFLRIFKAESELEVWMMKGKEFQLFATYPICQWSGVLGPKFYEGDNQSPEGFYTVGRRDLKWQTRHHRAFNIGFPNAFDKLHGRTGSNILVHGGCSTEGCFAMTNPVIDEVFRLANSAVASGQKEIQVHVFPFRMTAENLMRQSASPWLDFWINLKTGYDLFAETRLPPAVGVCKSRYVYDRVPEFGAIEPERDCEQPVATGNGSGNGSSGLGDSGGGNIVTTGSIRATAASAAPLLKLAPRSKPAATLRTPEERRMVRRAVRSRARDGSPPAENPREDASPPAVPGNPMGTDLAPGAAPGLRPATHAAALPALPVPEPAGIAELTPTTCSISRPSCRKWTAIQAWREVTRSAEVRAEQIRTAQTNAPRPRVAQARGIQSAR